MNRLLTVLLFLYLLALHSSMAGMEILSWSIVAAVLVKKILRREAVWFPGWKPLALLTLAAVLSLLLNLPPGRPPLFQLGLLRWIVLLYFIAWALADVWSEAFEHRWTKTWAFALGVTGAYAVLQFFTGVDFIRSVAVKPQHGVWLAVGWFSAPLTFAYCIGFSLFAVAGPARRLRPKLWGFAAVGFGALGVIASMSRGAWGAMILCGALFYFVRNRRSLPWFLGSVVVTTAILCLFPTGIADKVGALVSLRLDHSTLLRTHLWRAYFEIFKDHPLFGAGIGQADLLVPEYYRRLGIDEIFVSHAHNVLLHWLASTGLFGCSMYVWISTSFLRLAWRLRRFTPWGLSLFLAQIYTHIGGLTENCFFDTEVTHNIVLGWAMLLVLERVYLKPS